MLYHGHSISAAVFFLLCLSEFFGRGFCCDSGWLRYGDRCIRVFSEPTTFVDGILLCALHSSEMVSISDENKRQLISTYTAREKETRFWVGLFLRGGKFIWKDGTEDADQQPYVHINDPPFIRYLEAFAYTEGKVVNIINNNRIGVICSRLHAGMNCTVRRQPGVISDVSHECIYRDAEMTTKAGVNAACGQGSHFQDLEDIVNNGLEALLVNKILENDGSKYWTGLTWNGTHALWPSGEVLDEKLFSIIRGSGSCIAVQFNYTESLSIHLYQMDCNAQAHVICASDLNRGVRSTTSLPLMDEPQLSCPQGYNWKSDPLTNHCYWETSFETERLSWNEAERYCQSFGGHLSSFHSQEEEKIGLSFQYGSLSHPYWIGLSLDLETLTYKWNDGTPLNYNNWAPGHPNHRDKRLRCVAMEAKEAHWVSSLCGILSWFICKAPKQLNPPDPVLPTPVPLQPCFNLDSIKASYYSGYCYFAVNNAYSWHRAKTYCENEGATLVSIHTDDEIGFLLKLLYETVMDSNRVWIGLNSLGMDGSFKWTDWSPLDFTYWNKDEPNNFQNQEKCCNMYIGNGLWNDENCNAQMGFICKRRNETGFFTTAPSTIDPRIGNCKKGWYAHHDRCYYLGGIREKDRANWTDASQVCQDLGGYLTSIRDEKDQAYLSYLLQFLKVDAWIGLHDTIQSGSYYWQDNSELQYTSWAPGEPSFFGIVEDCVKMVYEHLDSGVWKDDECDKKLGFICQNRKDPDLPEPPYDRGLECLHPEGWLKLDTMCFKMFEGNTLTWSEAESSCRRDGAHLVSVSDTRVGAVVSYLAAEVNKSFWIGLRYKEATQSVSWLNERPVAISNWEKNEPGFLENSVCFASTAEGYWKKMACLEQMPYVCQITTGEGKKLEKYTGNCPPTSKLWQPGNGSFCYILDKDYRSDWFMANLMCFRYGSNLVSIHSMEDIESLKKIMKPGVKSVYIGLLRNEKGGFSWTDDSPVNFVNWDFQEPENYEDQCVEMMADTMKWRLTRCIAKKHFICQDNKDTLTYADPKNEKLVDESTTGLSAPALAAIIISIVVIIIIIVAAAFFYNRSAGKGGFVRPFRQQSVSFENALYNVDSSSMEFQDESKGSL